MHDFRGLVSAEERYHGAGAEEAEIAVVRDDMDGGVPR